MKMIKLIIVLSLLSFSLVSSNSIAYENNTNGLKFNIKNLTLKEDIFDEEIEDEEILKILIVTAYTSSIKETKKYAKGITANNKKIKRGMVAVSRDLYKNGWTFGKKVKIKNIGIFEIQDLMHKRMKNSIDIYIADKEDALEFGRQKLEVKLL